MGWNICIQLSNLQNKQIMGWDRLPDCIFCQYCAVVFINSAHDQIKRQTRWNYSIDSIAMKITCDPNQPEDSIFCNNWPDIEFEIDGKPMPSWRVYMADDIKDEIKLFEIDDNCHYIYPGPGHKPNFHTRQGSVKIIGSGCTELKNCDRAYLSKKPWWNELNPFWSAIYPVIHIYRMKNARFTLLGTKS